MGQSLFNVAGGAMQCEWCRSNLANYKFSDSHIEKGATKVLCQSCYYALSLSCLRKDITEMHGQLEAIMKRLEVPDAKPPE